VEPADGRGIVADTKDAQVASRGGREALKPYIDCHAKKLQEVVDTVAAVQDAAFGNLDSPSGSSVQAEATNSKGARVGPDNSIGTTGDNEIHGYPCVGLGQERTPENKILENFILDVQTALFVWSGIL
jgi:hypothetical protein